MIDYEIPLTDIDTFFDFSIEISGKTYIIEMFWNVENEFWSISLFTSEKLPIFLGRKLVLNYDLFSFCSNPLLPPGTLKAVDQSKTFKDCGFEDLGNRVILIYSI